ncbi:Ms4527A family Cys-rich leader peptide [[Mycobacterium] burgundiense]|uniref:Ms4527A family Cys-rich leader peptide n=1 Tax=[Mycobacterium] burgundiense TaxID=3064286 RepID=UPI00359F6B46
MPNGPPRVGTNSSDATWGARTVMRTSVPDPEFCSGRAQIWPDWEVTPVHGRMAPVTAVRSLTHRVSLVARRHVDFKRVCTCCCLP